MSDFKKFSIVERITGGPAAPVEAPPTTKPQPKTEPTRRESPTPTRREDPWRRKDVSPNTAPRPKAAFGLDTTYSESARRIIGA